MTFIHHSLILSGIHCPKITFPSINAYPASFKPPSVNVFGKKGNAVPLQAWSGPEGSWKLRFPDFMTTAQYGGKPYAPAAFTPQEMLLVLISVRG